MTIFEKRSAARVKAIKKLVQKSEYSPEYALIRLDELNKWGLLVAKDYDETFDWLNELMEAEDEPEPVEEIGEPIE